MSSQSLTLIHGWGFGPRAWQPVLPLLSGRYDVRVLALPGYGGTDEQPGQSNTMADLADFIAESLPEKNPTILCGWSLGAFAALATAACHPSQVRALILVGGNARFTIAENWQEALPGQQLDEFVAALDRDPLALLKHFSLLIHKGDSSARLAIRAMSCCLADGLPAGIGTLRNGLELLRVADLRNLAPQVAQPTLLLHGEVDPLMPLAGAQRLAALLPNAALEVFTGAAHAPFASNPERLCARLDSFIRALA
jgi:pimeloyl-[acyl-carrier protein] methyl ester esterase